MSNFLPPSPKREYARHAVDEIQRRSLESFRMPSSFFDTRQTFDQPKASMADAGKPVVKKSALRESLDQIDDRMKRVETEFFSSRVASELLEVDRSFVHERIRHQVEQVCEHGKLKLDATSKRLVSSTSGRGGGLLIFMDFQQNPCIETLQSQNHSIAQALKELSDVGKILNQDSDV
ncbi:hypothetical protein GUITHDRAFT_150607 [Guillardia theta CCMP2712]|uniref:Uncharacterized protein n=1 Tax=Guillardia theta (strain CCMP2712) TaxID=905079 RepID=L1JWC0_GUITC|nr:hypothetical protein GUITHDRAFT_150607 [Guillardia theta CCMP2712]EKX52634.1 hypothetical protein GUITHDRAFT_150607 [Guillardia theta CCMP2712]|eukprot:XP_005839614.1 hypothetical protein GUITHDRAFT_150607 [Guillardia theta CCMP2712]